MHLLKIKPKLHHEMTAEKLLYLDYILRLLINSKFKPLATSLKFDRAVVKFDLVTVAGRWAPAATSFWASRISAQACSPPP